MAANLASDPAGSRPVDTSGKVARTARFLSILGAALALACIAYASYAINRINDRIAKAEAKLSTITSQVESKQQELEGVQAKLDQANAEVAFAQQAYQKIAHDLPPGAAQKAIQETAAADSAAANLPSVVYIHIANEDQRRKATEVQDALRNKGYIVPGIEYVGAKAPNHTQLRYFVRTDEGPVLDRTLALLRSLDIDVDGQFIVMASLRSLRPHQFELWFGQDYHPGQTGSK